jgi:hypothetical protein
MAKKRKPPEERKPEDHYGEAADDSLALAKVLAGQGANRSRCCWKWVRSEGTQYLVFQYVGGQA